jgi:excisionase family DNA binding protein
VLQPLGCWPPGTDYVAGALKQPDRTMAGTWVGPHDRPVGPARSRVTPASSLPPLPPSWPDEHPVHSGPGTAIRVRGTKGMRVAAQPSGKAAPDLPSYLHTAEVADILHVSPKTVSRWAKEGRLPFLKTLGGHRRYPAAEIRRLADELQVRPTA